MLQFSFSRWLDGEETRLERIDDREKERNASERLKKILKFNRIERVKRKKKEKKREQ